MFNTVNNMSRKSDKYGNVHFISFLGAVLSRLAYCNDNKFLTLYNSIMGPVIQPKILESINNVSQTNLSALLDDQSLFGLDKSPTDIFKDYEYQYNGKNYIDFIKLKMPQNINIINGDLKGNVTYPVPGTPFNPENKDVKYISIGWSNYGEVYIVADKRMSNTIFLLFRGTYSAKTASLYSKITSAVPLTVCTVNGKPETFLYGIFKPTCEIIHTIIESMRYLATDFLGATNERPVKIFTTGHSLGGAMCTNFAYLWMGIKKTSPYTSAPYNVLADNIICVSLGAPRCMGTAVADQFCNFVKNGKILYLRITTRGDPVTALPPKNILLVGPKSIEFQHPCSTSEDMRRQVSEDCNAQLTMRPTPNVNYDGNLDCQNYKTRAYVPNPLSHTIYLDIIYTKAVDILNFLKGVGVAMEVSRGSGKETNCRLVVGQNADYNAVFFDVNSARANPNDNTDVKIEAAQEIEITEMKTKTGGFFWKSKPNDTQQVLNQANSPQKKQMMPTMPKIGGPVAEDLRMTNSAFNILMGKVYKLQGNLCPQKPSPGQVVYKLNDSTTFPDQVLMPKLDCSAKKFNVGGARRRTRKHTSKRHTRRHTTKRHTRKHNTHKKY